MRHLAFLFLALVCFAPRGFSQNATLRSGDVFDLRLGGMPAEYAQEYAGQYTIGDDGGVGIPYIGEVKAAGLSVGQLSKAIEAKLVADKIFTAPTAIISLPQQSRTVTIGGAVRSPQAMPWSPDLSLSSAISRAGGASDFGNMKKIKVVREHKTTIYNLTKKEKDPSQNPNLMPGDEIEVME